jgi:hypothetical protein
MKFSFAIVAVFLASASASPVLEARSDVAIVERGTAHPKRGAAFNTAGAVSPLAARSVEGLCDDTGRSDTACSVSWAYDWSPAPIGSIPSGVEFVPMLWVRISHSRE